MISESQIRKHLESALQIAKKAFELGNYPIGAVFVDGEGNHEIVEMNECKTLDDITAHAEILGIRKLGNKFHKDSPGEYYLFTSLEPCFGCSFFLARTNVTRIYSALKDPHKGGISDLKPQEQFHNFFKNIELIHEPYEDLKKESKELMQKYFLINNKKDSAIFYGYKE